MTLGPSSSAFVSFLSYHWLSNVATSFENGPLLMHSSLRMKIFIVVDFLVCVNSTGEDYSVMVVDMYFALELVDDSLLVVACSVSVLVDDNVNAAFVDADIFPLLMRSYLLLIE